LQNGRGAALKNINLHRAVTLQRSLERDTGTRAVGGICLVAVGGSAALRNRNATPPCLF
jgi:hypothetical protein